MDLFRYRFNELTEGLRQKFLEHVNLKFEAVSMLLPGFVLCSVCLMFLKLLLKVVSVLLFKKINVNLRLKKTIRNSF